MNLSELDICNAALDFAGAGKILSLDTATDRSPEAAACRRHWPAARQYVFESHPWKCLSKQATLTTKTTNPQFGFANAYPLPIDFVRMMGMDDVDDEYKVHQGILHTDDSPAYIEYVYLCTDVTKYTAGLILALELTLGYFLNLALRQDVEIANTIMGHLERFFLPIIRHSDASGQGQRTWKRSVLTDLFR